MAVTVKDFKIKAGLIVEGTTGTINNFDILTKKQADQDYIVGLVGGSGTPDNTPSTLVKRDESGNFAAGNVTVNQLTIDGAGSITNDDDDFRIQTTEGGDFDVYADDIYFSAGDDFRVEANDLVRITSTSGVIHLDAANAYFGDMEDAADRIATEGYVTDAIGNIDLTFNTDEITEGTTNRYFTEERIDDHISGSYPIEYDAGEISLAVATDGGLVTDEGGLYVNRTIVNTWYDANGAAATAETNAINHTNTALEDYTTTEDLDTAVDGLGYLKSADLGDYATQTYVNDAVDALVDGAPGLLDTLNEIAAAINDDANYATTMTTALAGKQNNLTAGDNISIVSDTVSVTGLDSADISDFNAAAVTANAGLWDTIGAASAAQSAAETFATNADTTLYGTVTGDIATAKSEAGVIAQGYADTAEANAESYADGLVSDLQDAVDALTTDDVSEGANNEYFTDVRAKASAMALLVDADTTNVTIEYNVAATGLVITAENGVADSTTDDLSEGEENLYFTDERAIDAVSSADIYPNAVIIDDVAKQVASQLVAATAGVQVGHAWAKADYRSAEFLVKVAYGTHTEISKVLVTLDTADNIAITEYGIVGTNGSASSISAGISGTDVQLLVTTANINSTVTVVGTLLV